MHGTAESAIATAPLDTAPPPPAAIPPQTTFTTAGTGAQPTRNSSASSPLNHSLAWTCICEWNGLDRFETAHTLHCARRLCADDVSASTAADPRLRSCRAQHCTSIVCDPSATAIAMAFAASPAGVLTTPTPFLLIEAATASAAAAPSSAPPLEQRNVLLWLEGGPHPAGPLGALCWRQTAGAITPRSGTLPLHTLSDVRLGSLSPAMRPSAAVANLPAARCLSLQYTVAACARAATAASSDAAATVAAETEYRGLPCKLHSLDLCAPEAGGVDLAAWVTALLAHLERRLQRRLLTPALHAALPLPVPSTMLHAMEGGIDVLLHSRPDDGAPVQSSRSVLWFNVQRDTLFWQTLDAANQATFPEHDDNGLELERLTDVFVGIHDPLWEEVAAQAAAGAAAGTRSALPVPDDESALTLVGSHDDASSESVPLELRVQTLAAGAQQLLLDLIQYANDRSEEGVAVQSNVVVEVAEEGKQLAPRFYTQPPVAQRRKQTASASAAAAAAPQASTPAAAMAASPSLSAAAAAPAAASAAASTSVATSPSSDPSAHSNPDLTSEPTMQCLLGPGMAVTIFSRSAAASPADLAAVKAQKASLVYVHDQRSGMGQLRWSCADGAAGRANFEDVTDVHRECCIICIACAHARLRSALMSVAQDKDACSSRAVLC